MSAALGIVSVSWPAVAGLAFGVALLACHLLATCAPRLGWLDRPAGEARARKLQAAPVPPVAGAAVLLGWLAALIAAGEAPLQSALLPGAHPLLPAAAEPERVRLGALLALGAAFALGTLDDLRRAGLGPAVKLAGQLAAGALLALPVWLDGAQGGSAALGATLVCALAGAVALNALNTFDNADGAAGGLAALGLGLSGAPVLGAAVAGVLPANLRLRRGARGTPRAYLGDGGSHLLGMALLVVPGAWPALGLPLLDLGRVALERLRAGQPPWRGDRRHLAHRLERRGWGPRATALALWTAGAPPLLLPALWGWLALALAFCALVIWSAPAKSDACEGSQVPR